MSNIHDWLNDNPADSEDRSRLNATVLSAPDLSPDDAAAQRRRAIEAGVSPALADHPLTARAAESQRLQRIHRDNPRLGGWLSQPENYAIARDDTDNLSVFEQIARAARDANPFARVGRGLAEQGDTWRRQGFSVAGITPPSDAGRRFSERVREGTENVPGGYTGGVFRALTGFVGDLPLHQQGMMDREYSALGYRAQLAQRGFGAPLTPEEQQRLDYLATRPGQEDWGPPIIGPTLRLFPQIEGSFEAGGQAAAAGAGDVWRAFYADPDASTTTNVLKGVGAVPLAAIVGAGSGLGGYLGFSFEQETGQAYDQMVRSGVDPDIAANRSEQYGLWATAIELFGDSLGLKLSGAFRLFGRTTGLGGAAATQPLRALAMSTAQTALDEGIEEAAQQAAQAIHQHLAETETRTGRDASAMEVLQAWQMSEDDISQIIMSFYIGAQGGAGLAAIPGSLNFALDMRAQRAAAQAAQQFEQQTRAAQASRLTERQLPDALESAVGAMDESNVWIDADQFVEHFQTSGADPYRVATELGVGAENLAQAVAAHGQVQLPTARFAARVLAFPEHARLAEHARTDPTALTPAEARQVGERMQADVARIVEETQAAQTADEIGQAVEGHLRNLFARAAEEGGPRPEIAARYARLVAALPRTLLARARTGGDAEYTARLEGQLRRLFGEDLDIAGPTRGMEAGTGTDLNQGQPNGARGAGTARGSATFRDERLSATENKIAEMALNNYSNAEIADEMEISPSAVGTYISRIRNKGIDVEPGIVSGRPTDVSIERLVKVRDDLRASGHGRGINRMLAERFHLTPANVKQRLWLYDKQNASREQAPTMRRAKPFDLSTADARAEWLAEHVLVEPIPGEAGDARQYGFALDSGEVIVMSIAPEPTGSATVEWTFLDRLKRARDGEDVDLFGPGSEKLGVRGVLALMARVAAVLEADVANFRRDSYVYTPNSDALAFIYARLVNRIIGPMPYATVDDEAGSYYLVRDGAEIARNGTVIRSQENANANAIEWPSVDPAEVRSLQDAYYARLERFAEAGADARNREGGQQENAGGGSPEAGGRVSGTRGPGDGGLEQSRTRGSIRYENFRAGEFGQAVIRMGEASDLSTFLHEFGHLGHLVLESIATDQNAPAEFKQMWQATLGWWGVSQEQWRALSDADKVQHFERWARTFEAYLMEGKAPSLSLREAFAAFKAWLTQIYRSVFALDHKLNPEIRDVFDRLLATDGEIAEARAAMGADFNLARDAFKTDEEFQAYQQAINDAREAEEGELRAQVMDRFVRKEKRWWRAERARVRTTAEIEVDSDPARRAYEWLAFENWTALPVEQNDEGAVLPPDAALAMPDGLPSMRLDPRALEADYGPDVFESLPVGLRPIVDPDAALADAMALKRQARVKQPQRLWAFIKAQGGIKDEGGEISQALGSARARPGLINNASGIDPDELALRAWEAGYFGAKPRKGEHFQSPNESDGSNAGRVGSGIRRYETNNVVVLISDRPEGFREINWDVAVDEVGTLPLRERAAIEREGIDAAMAALVEDVAANPGARYYFQPDNPALARRYTRMVQDRAASYGYQAVEADGVVELTPQPNSSHPGFELFQAAPIFVSAVERTIAQSSTARAPASQWWATISKAPGVKKEELQWLGLEDWLKAQEGQVSREDVLAFVRENGVKVEETVLGGDGAGGASTSARLADLERELLPLIEEDQRLTNEQDELLYGDRSVPGRDQRLEEIKQRQNELWPRMRELKAEQAQLSTQGQPKWSQYTLPGGENYRELLLRQPTRMSRAQEGIDAFEGRLTAYAQDKFSLTDQEAGDLALNAARGQMDASQAAMVARDPRAQQLADELREAYTIRKEEHASGAQTFQSSHFSQANILAHVRFNERVDSEGRRTLFIEEVQSDWHQGGRERGYGKVDTSGWTATATAGRWIVRDANGVEQGSTSTSIDKTAEEAIAAQALRFDLRSVPDAPFKNNAWASLAMKRMIRWAAENGFEQIAWTRGQHQVERFSLSQHVQSLEYNQSKQRLYYVRTSGETGAAEVSSPADLVGLVGKEVAEQLLAQPLERGSRHMRDISGVQVGGHGMVAFYDKILPNIANDLGKKFGARVGEAQVNVEPRAGENRINPTGTPETVHSLPITPQMRESVVTRGAELFQDEDVTAARRPTPRELLDALIDDLKNVRQVYSVNDANAVAAYQNRADALRWFEARDIDLSGTKEEIRAQIVAALEREAEQPNGVHPDDAAPWFSFSSGDEMIQAIKGLKPRNQAIEENIDARLEGEYGDPLRDGTVAEAARLAAHVTAQAQKIELELAAIERATGGKARPVGAAAKAYAERQVQHMTIKQLRNADQFLAGERRAARNAFDAFKKKDYAEARRQKQRQLISFHLYRFARDAAEEMDKAQRYFQKFDRDTIRAKIHPPLLDQIDQALEGIDLRAKPRISDRKRASFNAWLQEMQAEGLEHMVVADQAFLDEAKNKPFAALTLEEARGLRDAVRNFEHIGRRWREVLGARDARLLDEAVAEMTASMAEVKPLSFERPEDQTPGVVETIDRARQGFHAQLSRVEFVARAMDRQKDNGPVWNGLFRPLTEARDREETRQQQAARDIEALFSVYSAKERADMWTKRTFYPQVPNKTGSRMGRNFTKQEILAIALNTGTEYNWQALIAGEDKTSRATEAQFRSLLDAAMDERDWQFVQSLWDYVDTFWPEIEALYQETAGVPPPKVQATPFQNRYGEWRGGYWHLDYDYGRDQRVREEAEQGAVQEAFGGNRLRTQTPNGFSKARQGSGGRPVRLELSILTEHVNEVIHDLEFRKPVLNAWRLIKHGEFRNAFVRAAGQAQYDQLKPWLQYVATERMPPERGFAGVIKLLRRNTPIALMGYAISTVAQQPAGLLGTFHRVGVGRVMGKALELASQPWTWMDHARFINSRSTLMRNRTLISQREIREMVQEINDQAHIDAVHLLATGTMNQKVQAMAFVTKLMQRYALFPLAYLDKWVSSAAWKAAYDKALGGHVDGIDAQNEADVIAYADQIIRTTFGSGRPEDLSPVMRSSEVGKLITPAFSYFNTQYNQLYNEQAPGMMRGHLSPLEFATFITFTLVLQALMSEWLAGRWEPDDDEDEDDRRIRLALSVAQTPVAGIPLVRDMTRSGLQAATTGQSFGTSIPAIGAISSTGTGLGGAINDLSEDGSISRHSARDLTMAAGYWFGLPTRQLWTTGSYVSDVASGLEDAPWDSGQPIDAWSEALLRDTR